MVPGVAALPTQWDLLGSQNREETCPLSVGILSIYCCLANPPDLRGLQHPTSLNIAWVFPGPEAQSRLAGQFRLRGCPEVAARCRAGSQRSEGLSEARSSDCCFGACRGFLNNEHILLEIRRGPASVSGSHTSAQPRWLSSTIM